MAFEASCEEAPERFTGITTRQAKLAGSAETGIRRLLLELQPTERFSVA